MILGNLSGHCHIALLLRCVAGWSRRLEDNFICHPHSSTLISSTFAFMMARCICQTSRTYVHSPSFNISPVLIGSVQWSHGRNKCFKTSGKLCMIVHGTQVARCFISGQWSSATAECPMCIVALYTRYDSKCKTLEAFYFIISSQGRLRWTT